MQLFFPFLRTSLTPTYPAVVLLFPSFNQTASKSHLSPVFNFSSQQYPPQADLALTVTPKLLCQGPQGPLR